MTVTVAVLCYGDHPDLAQRCLAPIYSRLGAGGVRDLRIGLNEVCPQTLRYVRGLLETSPVPVKMIHCPENRLKYPVMRRMLHHWPLEAPLLMWFDDDSYIQEEVPAAWWSTLPRLMGESAMIGKRYRLVRPLHADQQQWVRQQPWYTGRPISRPPRFITGGWWVIRSEVIRSHDWPPPCARHQGGDSMLGVLLDQQQLPFADVPGLVATNASKRRGVRHVPPPLQLGGSQCREPVEPFPCIVSTKQPGEPWQDVEELL